MTGLLCSGSFELNANAVSSSFHLALLSGFYLLSFLLFLTTLRRGFSSLGLGSLTGFATCSSAFSTPNSSVTALGVTAALEARRDISPSFVNGVYAPPANL